MAHDKSISGSSVGMNSFKFLRGTTIKLLGRIFLVRSSSFESFTPNPFDVICIELCAVEGEELLEILGGEEVIKFSDSPRLGHVMDEAVAAEEPAAMIKNFIILTKKTNSQTVTLDFPLFYLRFQIFCFATATAFARR